MIGSSVKGELFFKAINELISGPSYRSARIDHAVTIGSIEKRCFKNGGCL